MKVQNFKVVRFDTLRNSNLFAGRNFDTVSYGDAAFTLVNAPQVKFPGR